MMRTSAMFRFWIFVPLLVCSLVSQGPYVQLAGIMMLSVPCLLDTHTRAALLGPRSVAVLAIGAAVITGFFLWALAVPHANASHELEEAAPHNFVFLMLVLWFGGLFSALVRARPTDLTGVLKTLLLLHCSALVLQTILLVTTHHYLDFVQPVTGEASRYQNYASVNPVFAFRPTGLYVEPSTFSAGVGIMAIGYILLCRSQNRLPSLLPILLTVFCMLTTQSAAAVVQAGVLIVALVLTYGRRARIWFGVAAVLAAIAAPGLISAYLGSFMLKFSADSGLRYALIDYVFHGRQGWDYLFGYGPFSLEYDLFNLASTGQGAPEVASLNDSGLLNFFVVEFGIAGLAIPLAIFLRIRKDISTLCFFVLLMSCKLSYTAPVLYFALLPMLLRLGANPAPKRTNWSASRALTLEAAG